jgi:ornithine carbamoyltransferase
MSFPIRPRPKETPMNVKITGLLKEVDLGPEDFLALVASAAVLKRAKHEGTETPRLQGKNIALVFEKSSTRTRSAFEVAAHDQGASATYIGPDGSHIGTDESIADTARVLGSMYDGIEFRGFGQDTVEVLARNAGVPVWNGLTDQWHPTQMLADILTMSEFSNGPLADLSYAFVGDGRSNVARSLLVTGAMLGLDVRIAAPAELQPPADVQAMAADLESQSGAEATITDDPVAAVKGAEFVYTDVWVSMGEAESEWDHRVPLLTPYRVSPELMASTGLESHFMHCLPAIHDHSTTAGARILERYGLDGAEVDDAVFSSASSVVFTQAENRLHTIKAVLVASFED